MNEHKNIITIEDEIKEFSDKPVKSSALYKKVKELESNAVPDASEASVGDVLTKGEDGIGWSAPSGGGVFFHATIEPGDNPTVTFAEPHADIAAAIRAGKNVQVIYEEDGSSSDYNIASLIFWLEDGEHFAFMFRSPLGINVRPSRTDIYGWEFGAIDNTTRCSETFASLENHGTAANT